MPMTSDLLAHMVVFIHIHSIINLIKVFPNTIVCQFVTVLQFGELEVLFFLGMSYN